MTACRLSTLIAPFPLDIAKVIQVFLHSLERRFSAALLLDEIETDSPGAFGGLEDPPPRRSSFSDQRWMPGRVIRPVRAQHRLNAAGILFDK